MPEWTQQKWMQPQSIHGHRKTKLDSANDNDLFP